MPRQSTTTPKRLIVCCDGTWMASDHASKDDSSYQTNITRMCHALADDGVRDGKLVPQIVYYQDGVGTSGPDFLKVLAGGLGWGVDHNILAAYNFLVNNYAPDDEIYLFGFSRGSFTCRSLAGLISKFGILKQSESGKYFARIWERYQGIVSDKGTCELEERGKVSHDVRIKVMGCWDTVGSLGIPEGWFTKLFGLSNKYAFHNTDISDKIEHAFHALALDERRGPFTPTLWYIPPSSKKEDRSTTLKQCWFPGVHTDIGRGYDDHVPGDMADIAFAWMVEQCTEHLSFCQETLNGMMKGGDFNPQKPHDERQKRKEKAEKWGMVDLHDSMRTLVGWLTISKTRTPGQYSFRSRNLVRDKRNGSWRHITGAANTSSDRETSMVTASLEVVEARPPTKPWYKRFIAWLKGVSTRKSRNKHISVQTLECIHPCVRVRMFKDPEYDPPSLRGYKLVRDEEQWSWEKQWTADNGTVRKAKLPEYHGSDVSSARKQVDKDFKEQVDREMLDYLERHGEAIPPRVTKPWWKFW